MNAPAGIWSEARCYILFSFVKFQIPRNKHPSKRGPTKKKRWMRQEKKNGGRGTWIETHAQAALTLVFKSPNSSFIPQVTQSQRPRPFTVYQTLEEARAAQHTTREVIPSSHRTVFTHTRTEKNKECMYIVYIYTYDWRDDFAPWHWNDRANWPCSSF